MAAITCFGFVDDAPYQHQERTRIPSALTHGVARDMYGVSWWVRCHGSSVPDFICSGNGIHKKQESLQMNCYNKL